MKKITFILLLFLATYTLQAISPYYLVADVSGDLKTVETSVINALEAEGFSIIGKYSPANNGDQRVIVYSSPELQQLCGTVDDRGLMAAALKVAIWNRDGKVRVTMLNPEYLFYVYLRDEMDKSSLNSGLMKIHAKASAALKTIGTTMKPFGGDLEKKDLKKYKYMMGMPKFDAPVELREFDSFQQGLNTIQMNLSQKVGSTVKVFEIVNEENQTALFGVGLMDKEEGEAHFLPIVGEKQIAAMPYEIMLQGNTATILHGRFRFASHWPELTMGTFTKIMSSPGDVKDFLKALTE